MTPGAIAILSLSMSTDAFAAAVGRGAAHRPTWPAAVRAGLVFGVIEAITPIIGWGLGMIAAATLELGLNLATRVQPLAVAAGLFVVALAVLYLWPSRWATPAVVALGAAGGVVLLSS